MAVFEGVFTKRGEAEALNCSPTGVFEEVFVKRGRWRKSSASALQQSSDDVVQLAEHINSALPTVEYPMPSLSDLDHGAGAKVMPKSMEVAIKNTFVNAAILDFDSLQDFLKERKVKSCPASRQVSSVTMLIDDLVDAADANMTSKTKDEVLNTASSFGGISCTPNKKLTEYFNTASTITGADFELIQQRISEVAPDLDVFLNTASTLAANKGDEATLDDQELLYNDRLSSLRMKGSEIQQHIGQATHNENQPASGLDVEAPPCQQLQTPNQWFVTVQTANGVVPGIVTLLGNPQQQTQLCPTPPNMPSAPILPPPPVAAPVLRLAEAIAPPELGGPDLPSIGSLLHHKGECKPCTFFHTRGCENKEDCKFCHLCGSGEKKKRLKALKAAQREANYAALENAKAILASYSAAEEQSFQADTIIE